MTALRAAIDLARDLPRLFAVSLTRWVRNQHGPFDKYGDGTIAVCRRCWTTWPCDEWVKAADDLKELEDQ